MNAACSKDQQRHWGLRGKKGHKETGGIYATYVLLFL
jgi:hypothetical protein